jgi:signal peptidase II
MDFGYFCIIIMKIKIKSILFIASNILFVGIDWYTKFLAKKHLFYVRANRYLDGHFILDYAENKGAALSFGANLPSNQAVWVLEVLPGIILLILLIYIVKNLNQLSVFSIICFAGLFAGGFANLFDRLQNKRQVIDFMIVNIGSFQTGIFNFADVFISFGVIGLLFISIFSKESVNDAMGLRK